MASKFKVWIHVEEIGKEDGNTYYEECGCPFDMGEFETEGDAWDYAGELSRSMDETNELIAAAKDVIDTWEVGDLAGAVRRLEGALRGMEVRS